MKQNNPFEGLNAKTKNERLESLRAIKAMTDAGKLKQPEKTAFVNNHIHSTFSFSPYSPTKALYMAWQNGLSTAGIMDHDSVGGALEFCEAGSIIGMPVTVGMECRVNMAHTKIGMQRINNPDQTGVGYVALHGIPHQSLDAVAAFMKPYRIARNARNIKMCDNINALMRPYDIAIDFETDVLPLSEWKNGGSVTERHVLYALTQKIIKLKKNPDAILAFLTSDMGLSLSDKAKEQIKANEPTFVGYDILGVLKANLVSKIYVDADAELPPVEDYIALCEKTGAVSAYAYLGDVGNSVTGDKKAQTFEDAYLDLLFEELHRLGFDAVTYMPTRNTPEQLGRVMTLCRKYGFFQISGEDINSPRQSFLCQRLCEPAFAHLVDATYALIGHEQMASENAEQGMFSAKTVAAIPDINERIERYASYVRRN